MNDIQRVFKIDEGYRKSMLLFGILSSVFLLLALISSVSVIVKPRSPIAIILVLAMDVFLLWLAIYHIRYYNGSERYTVRVKDDGLRFGGDEAVPVIPWSEFRQLRTPRSSKHIEVLGWDDKPRGVIKLQLEGISDLLQTLMNTLWNADPQIGVLLPRPGGTLRFKASPFPFIIFQVFTTGLIALAIKLDPDKWYAVPIFFSLVWLSVTYGFLKGIRWIEFSENFLVVKTVFSRRRFTGGDISSVELSVPPPGKSGHLWNVLIRSPKEKMLGICPNGQDPFTVFWNCRRFLNRSDEIRVFQQEK